MKLLPSNHYKKSPEPEWVVNSDYPTEEEVQREIANLKQDKAASAGEISPLLFNERGELLTSNFTRLLRIV